MGLFWVSTTCNRSMQIGVRLFHANRRYGIVDWISSYMSFGYLSINMSFRAQLSLGCNWTIATARDDEQPRVQRHDAPQVWFLAHQRRQPERLDRWFSEILARHSKMTKYFYLILPFFFTKASFTTTAPWCSCYWFLLHNGLNVWSTTMTRQLLTAPKQKGHNIGVLKGIYNTHPSHTNLVEVQFLKSCCERGSSKSIMFFLCFQSIIPLSAAVASTGTRIWHALHFSMHPASPEETVQLLLSLHLSSFLPATK
jgi:hypothetical protein